MALETGAFCRPMQFRIRGTLRKLELMVKASHARTDASQRALDRWMTMTSGAGIPAEKERTGRKLLREYWTTECSQNPALAYPMFSALGSTLVNFHLGDMSGVWLDPMVKAIERLDEVTAEFDPFGLDMEDESKISAVRARAGIIIEHLNWRYVLSKLTGLRDTSFLDGGEQLFAFAWRTFYGPDPYVDSVEGITAGDGPVPGERKPGEDADDYRFRLLAAERLHAIELLHAFLRRNDAFVTRRRGSRLFFPEGDERHSARVLINLSSRLSDLRRDAAGPEHRRVAHRLVEQLTVNHWTYLSKAVPEFVDVPRSWVFAARFAYEEQAVEAPNFGGALLGFHPLTAEAALKKAKAPTSMASGG